MRKDSTERETDQYKNIHNDGEKNMNSEKRTEYQINTRRINTDRYRRKGVTKRSSNRINKNRETGK